MSEHAKVSVPYPAATKLSERMANLSALFGLMNSYAAEGSFKVLSEEVATMERDHGELIEALRELVEAETLLCKARSARYLDESSRYRALTPLERRAAGAYNAAHALLSRLAPKQEPVNG